MANSDGGKVAQASIRFVGAQLGSVLESRRRRLLQRVLSARQLAEHPLAFLCLGGAISAVGGFTVHAHCFVILLAIIAVAGIGLLMPWLTISQVKSEVVFERAEAEEGEELVLRIKIRNCGPIPVEAARLNGLGLDVPMGAISLRPFQHKHIAVSFVSLKRGIYPVGHLYLSTVFPFGLTIARKQVAVTNSCVVWPARLSADILPIGLTRAAEQSADVSSHLRSYRRGDSIRQIHFAQSAKHDQLIVREYERQGSGKIHLVIDHSIDSYAGLDSGAHGPWEQVIRLAATLYHQMVERRESGVLIVGGRAFEVRRRSLRRAMKELAGLEQGNDAIALRSITEGTRRGAKVVVLTSESGARAHSGNLQARGKLAEILAAPAGSVGPPYLFPPNFHARRGIAQ